PAAPKGCTAGSGRGPLEKDPHSGNLASGLPVLTHGRLPGRDFRLELLLLPHAFRIEVTDTRPERRPGRPATEPASPDVPSGRGLLLVEAYAERWGWQARDAYTKTVWAEVARSV
ncbi:ATP-binding protein, partial [Streptomyces sp. NPDC059909]|uniref:ATP-binding protein n=1 Tax=Streptomyces sp. NPDC059909 TaxID=3346998 RepID=UPI003648C33C